MAEVGDIARVGIIVDATGARREIKLTTEELKKLANGGKEAQQAMRTVAPPAAVVEMQKTTNVIRQMREAKTQSTVSADRLRGSMTSLAIASGALPGPLGRVASVLGSFALGGGIMVGVLAGIAALGFAYEKLTEKSRKAREEFERQLEVLRKIKREQDLGIAGEAGDASGAGRARLNEIRGAMQATNALMKSGQITGPAFAILATRRAALIEEYQALEPIVLAGEKKVREIMKKSADEEAEERKRRAREREQAEQDAFAKRIAFIKQQHEMERSLFPERFNFTKDVSPTGALGQSMTEEALRDGVKNMGIDFQMFVLPALNTWLDAMKQGADEAERAAKAAQEQKDALVLGAGIGVMSGIASRMGGPVGGVATGLINGIGGGPLGMATGAFNGFVTALFDLGNSSKQQREEMERLRNQYDAFTDSIKEQLGLMTPLEVRIRAVTREFAAAREPFEEIATGVAGMMNDIFNNPKLEEAKRNIGELTRLEREYLDLLKQQEQQRINDIQSESVILKLRIQGNDELADSMARTIEKQQELRAAMDAGASSAEIMAIKERQRLEDILAAVEKTTARIAALDATISGLQSFRNALLLSDDAGLSPTDRLSEARRQYEEILAKAMGGDQAAAGQLSGAAQALLNFSRSVNASGAGFQSDLAKVLADNAAVIAKFEDLKTIEELMLEELRKIAENTFPIRNRDGTGTESPRDDGRGLLTADESAALTSSVEVMQVGFLELRGELRIVQQKLDEQTLVTKNGLDGWLTANNN